MNTPKSLSSEQAEVLLKMLQKRFEKNMNRHPDLEWEKIKQKLVSNPDKLWKLNEMEESGGEPDVLVFDGDSDFYTFVDCSPETPKGRRSICYDQDALDSRKEFKPKNSAVGMADEMGIEILNTDQYAYLQQIGRFDTKTSSWLKTPEKIRELGGAIFGDRRYNTVFTYHNGAESYYTVRGFRGLLKI